MSLTDIFILAIRNLRESRLRTFLTSSGVAVGVAVVVTMVSFGLGLQRNTVSRFRDIELFNEVTVSGRSLVNIVSGGEDPEQRRARPGGRSGAQKAPERILNDAAIEEMQAIAGIESVEPTIFFTAYLRANNRTLLRTVGGALVPNTSPRFKEFAAGFMIAERDAEEVVVDETFARDFGFERPRDAVGQSVEFLALASDVRDEEPLSFFGLPLEEEGRPTDQNDDKSAPRLIARSFRISGVLKEQINEASGARRVRGLAPTANVYIPSAAARSMAIRYRSALSEVALELARSSGVLNVEDEEGYQSAVIRVSDPSYVTDIRKKIRENGL